MRALTIALAACGVMIAPYAANAQFVDDPFNDYLQRSNTIFMGAGNAKDVNAAIHTINPWPPYVRNTHIHTTGRQGADAVERMYKLPNRFEREGTATGPALSVTTSGTSSGETTTSLTGAPPTPVQPVTSGN